MRDPFIAEIRKARHQMALEMKRDPEAFRARLQEHVEKFAGRVVGLDLRPIKKKVQSTAKSKRSK